MSSWADMKWRSLEESSPGLDARPLREIYAERKELIAKYVPPETQAVHAQAVAELKARHLQADWSLAGAGVPLLCGAVLRAGNRGRLPVHAGGHKIAGLRLAGGRGHIVDVADLPFHAALPRRRLAIATAAAGRAGEVWRRPAHERAGADPHRAGLHLAGAREAAAMGHCGGSAVFSGSRSGEQ